MSLFDFFKRKPTVTDSPTDLLGKLLIANSSLKKKLEATYGEKLNDPLQRAMILAALKMQIAADSGCDSDEIPNREGRFGYDITNPIPVNMPSGLSDYLGRLRLLSGDTVETIRIGSTSTTSGSEGTRDTVDIVEVRDSIGNVIDTLYFSVYHKRTSKKPPEGFRLL